MLIGNGRSFHTFTLSLALLSFWRCFVTCPFWYAFQPGDLMCLPPGYGGQTKNTWPKSREVDAVQPMLPGFRCQPFRTLWNIFPCESWRIGSTQKHSTSCFWNVPNAKFVFLPVCPAIFLLSLHMPSRLVFLIEFPYLYFLQPVISSVYPLLAVIHVPW